MSPHARGRLALMTAILLIAAAVLPRELQNHPHWEKVGWIPFVTHPIRLRDIIANILLFAPLGGALAACVRRAGAVPLAMLLGAVLSLLAESIQLYSHTRFPSATDLTCNAAGAGVGAWLMLRGFRAVTAPSLLRPRPQTAD